MAAEGVKAGKLLSLIHRLTVFYGIFYFMAWIFVSLRLIFCGFFIDLIYESFKVAIDVDFAVFGTVGFCSN